MKNLFELTELTRNDEEMIELKIKENSSEDLLELGFPGTETFIRLYRGDDRRIEKIKGNQRKFTWCEHEPVPSDLQEQRRKIYEAIIFGYNLDLDEFIENSELSIFKAECYHKECNYRLYKDGKIIPFGGRYLGKKLERFGWEIIEEENTEKILRVGQIRTYKVRKIVAE
jgi:hypothetical protein